MVRRTMLRPRMRDLGDGFTVRRLLPAAQQRSVGPFVFFDHMGPVVVHPGDDHDVRPHPHIGLATVPHLFEGSMCTAIRWVRCSASNRAPSTG